MRVGVVFDQANSTRHGRDQSLVSNSIAACTLGVPYLFQVFCYIDFLDQLQGVFRL